MIPAWSNLTRRAIFALGDVMLTRPWFRRHYDDILTSPILLFWAVIGITLGVWAMVATIAASLLSIYVGVFMIAAKQIDDRIKEAEET